MLAAAVTFMIVTKMAITMNTTPMIIILVVLQTYNFTILNWLIFSNHYGCSIFCVMLPAGEGEQNEST